MFGDLLTAYTKVGKLKGVPVGEVEIEIALLDPLSNSSFWLVLNGWFGKDILWVGTDPVIVSLPKLYVTSIPIPLVIPIPTDSIGLK